jgi:hypothetical protein
MNKKNWTIIYPLLLGIYPALGLVSANISQMVFLAGVRSIIVAALFSLAMVALFSWRIRDEYKAALSCAWFFLFFFAYGHVYDAIEGWKVFGILFGRHILLFPLWWIMFGLGAWWILKKAKPSKSLTRSLNIFSIILLVIPIIQISAFEWQRAHPVPEKSNAGLLVQGSSSVVTAQSPDVYYIILDGYARDDILLKNYHLDINDFIGQLEDLGFYVPRCSQSNYGLTALSLSSSLNMNTLDQILPEVVAHGENVVAFNTAIKHSLVRKFFEDKGYKTVSFENNIWWTEWSDSNYFITKKYKPFAFLLDFKSISEFEVLFLRTTTLRVVEEASNKWLSSAFSPVETPEKHKADLVLLALDELNSVPKIPGHKFVFLHLISPHEPYVFSPNGDFVVTKAADPGYPNQIQYLNSRLVPILRSIIKQSSVPPIIILQADHGRDPEYRMANFMAVYFPGNAKSVLYSTMTPINLFRLVLDNYFGQKLPLLPDISYYSKYSNSYKFTQVKYPCDPNR